ncbi:MAG TPA: hypothetical protein VFH68_17910 [Polyangia bacterium]|jgi:hypothetical protein|nr:hypothetical protein [Polyangia bacterium]
MLEHAIAPYPRRAGVIVPDLLRRAGCPASADAGDPVARARAAAEIVRWVGRPLRRLPAEVLDAPIPPPDVILRSWTLGPRTRGALARLGTAGGFRSWRVRDLIGAAGLGPAGFVDLLAAREEEARVPTPRLPAAPAIVTARGVDPVSTPIASRLADFALLLRGRLPLRPEELGDLLIAAGLSARHLTVDDVIRLFREWQLPIPFRTVRRSGATVLVPPASLASAEALVTTASQLVFHWGLCSLNSVVGRIRSLALADLGAGAAARVLASIPRFRWLDERSGWFSFAGTSSRVRIAIRKVFSVASRVPLRDLSAALAKRVKALATAPRAAVAAYLSEIAGCAIERDWVSPRASLVPAPLRGNERAIVDVFQRSGGRLTREILRRGALASGVNLAAVRHFIRTSPLVIARARDLRLVGLPIGAARGA